MLSANFSEMKYFGCWRSLLLVNLLDRRWHILTGVAVTQPWPMAHGYQSALSEAYF
jgi:hypothetical protein